MSNLIGKSPSESNVTLAQMMGPTDANHLGNVHGGIIMKLCDEAGAMAATKHSGRICVTVAVDSMSFHSPVRIGNMMTIKARVTWVGRTSIETFVEVTAEDVLTGTVTHTNSAYFVYVALGGHGESTSVPPLICETEEEKATFADALKRREWRLAQSKRQQGAD